MCVYIQRVRFQCGWGTRVCWCAHLVRKLEECVRSLFHLKQGLPEPGILIFSARLVANKPQQSSLLELKAYTEPYYLVLWVLECKL